MNGKTTAGLVASFLVASILVSTLLGLVGSATATLLELLEIPDDNLTMPVSAGGSMILASLIQESIIF